MRKKQHVQTAWGKGELSSSKKLKEGLCGLNMVTKGLPGLDVAVYSTSL